MKTECFLGLLVLVWGAVLASAGDLESYLDVITNPTHVCSGICQKNGVSCLPHWTPPTETHPHCERQQEDFCLMCLNLAKIFPGKVSCQDNEADEDQEPTCTAPCSNHCSFKDMCMPAKLDPNNHFHPHCTDEDDKNYPSQWCIYCLIKNSVLGKVPGITPTPDTTVVPTLDTTAVQIETTADTPVTYHTPTPPNCSRPPGASTPDPCLKFCDHYMQVCMPPDMDPCFFYYPHCDTYVEGYRPASAKCLQCINIHGLRPNSLATQTSPPPIYTPPPTIYTPPPTIYTPPETSYTPPATTSYTPPETSYTPPTTSYTPPATTSYTPPTTSYTPPATTSCYTPPRTSPSRPITLPWDCFCSYLKTTVIEAPVNACPKDGRYFIFPTDKGVTSAQWSCSCDPRNTDKEISERISYRKGRCRNCPYGSRGRCTCKRTELTIKRARIGSCAGFFENHRLCDLQGPSATENTVVTNCCQCTGCRWWFKWG